MENGANGFGFGFGDSHTNQNNGNHLYINRSLEVVEPEHSALNWNISLVTEGLRYAEHAISEALHLLSRQEKNLIHDNSLITQILPSVADSLCFFPASIPLLCGKFASSLLPIVLNCISLLTCVCSPSPS